MSFKGVIEAGCPRGCESEPTEVWSFVRGDQDEALREAMLAGELNMLVCAQCGELFFPEATVVYYDEKAQLLAFIFPEAYRSDEARWRAKMDEDLAAMRRAAPGKLFADDPLLYFGLSSFAQLLQEETDLEDEVNVAEHLCRGLGLKLHPVRRAWARGHHLPWRVPCPKSAELSNDSALEGLRILLETNDRLAGFARCRDRLRASREHPPFL